MYRESKVYKEAIIIEEAIIDLIKNNIDMIKDADTKVPFPSLTYKGTVRTDLRNLIMSLAYIEDIVLRKQGFERAIFFGDHSNFNVRELMVSKLSLISIEKELEEIVERIEGT